MVANATGNYEEVYGAEILNAMDSSRMYPRWEKRWSGYHYEEAEGDCCCEGEFVPDKDAVEYDVWVPYAPTVWGLLPKIPWAKRINKELFKEVKTE